MWCEFRSARGELGVDEHGAAVHGVRVLSDDRALDVVLVCSQALHNLRVEVRLGLSVSGVHQLRTVSLVAVLVSVPDGCVHLRGHLEGAGVQVVEGWIGLGVQLVELLLGVLGNGVEEVVGRFEIEAASLELIDRYNSNDIAVTKTRM